MHRKPIKEHNPRVRQPKPSSALTIEQFPKSSVQFSHSVVSDYLKTHGLQHARLPCPSSTPEACSNSCPSSRWYHAIISSSVIPFSSCLQSFPASGCFQWMSSSHKVAKKLEFQLQHQSFQWIFRVDFPQDWLAWSPCCARDSQELYITCIQIQNGTCINLVIMA